LTLILGKNDRIFWYVGITNPKVEIANFSANGIRKVLLQKNQEIRNMIVLIKPDDTSNYKNMVDILDEMTISNIQRYALVDITPVEKELIKNLN
jgi:biopolymer transport protein ExbD